MFTEINLTEIAELKYKFRFPVLTSVQKLCSYLAVPKKSPGCLSKGSHTNQLLGNLKLGQHDFTFVYSMLGQPILSETVRGKRSMTDL